MASTIDTLRALSFIYQPPHHPQHPPWLLVCIHLQVQTTNNNHCTGQGIPMHKCHSSTVIFAFHPTWMTIWTHHLHQSQRSKAPNVEQQHFHQFLLLPGKQRPLSHNNFNIPSHLFQFEITNGSYINIDVNTRLLSIDQLRSQFQSDFSLALSTYATRSQHTRTHTQTHTYTYMHMHIHLHIYLLLVPCHLLLFQ